MVYDGRGDGCREARRTRLRDVKVEAKKVGRRGRWKKKIAQEADEEISRIKSICVFVITDDTSHDIYITRPSFRAVFQEMLKRYPAPSPVVPTADEPDLCGSMPTETGTGTTELPMHLTATVATCATDSAASKETSRGTMTAEALHKARKPDESVAPTTPKYIDNCPMSGVWVPTLLVPHACADRIVVLIGGEAASGKSTLLEALTTRRGHRVNWHCVDIDDYTEPLIEEEFSSVDEYRHKFVGML
jgi:hypothetical protein